MAFPGIIYAPPYNFPPITDEQRELEQRNRAFPFEPNPAQLHEAWPLDWRMTTGNMWYTTRSGSIEYPMIVGRDGDREIMISYHTNRWYVHGTMPHTRVAWDADLFQAIREFRED